MNLKKNLMMLAIVTIFSHDSIAQEKEIIQCEQSASRIANLFVEHWEWIAEQQKYFAIVKTYIDGYSFSGALHTISATMPADNNPHLQFAGMFLKKISHYGLWLVDCTYTIGNHEISDLDDGLLHFTHDVDSSSYDCQLKNNRVECVRKLLS